MEKLQREEAQFHGALIGGKAEEKESDSGPKGLRCLPDSGRTGVYGNVADAIEQTGARNQPGTTQPDCISADSNVHEINLLITPAKARVPSLQSSSRVWNFGWVGDIWPGGIDLRD